MEFELINTLGFFKAYKYQKLKLCQKLNTKK